MGLFLKKRVEMPDKMILGNTEFALTADSVFRCRRMNRMG